MSKPEISHRCLSCGASVRAGASFCQQCGAEVKGEVAPPPPARGPGLGRVGGARKAGKDVMGSAAAAKGVAGGPDGVARAGAAAGGAKGGRVSAVRESLRPRVERVREASIVVLEEAADDSGLRFVLVAAALFLLSLLFLFVSTTLLR